jgi:hypothetical protein
MGSISGKTKNTARIHRSKRYETFANYAVIIVVLFTIFIIGGGVYDIIENPGSVVQMLRVLQNSPIPSLLFMASFGRSGYSVRSLLSARCFF